MKIKRKIIVTQIVLSVLLLGVICYEYIDNSISYKYEIQEFSYSTKWINISVAENYLTSKICLLKFFAFYVCLNVILWIYYLTNGNQNKRN